MPKTAQKPTGAAKKRTAVRGSKRSVASVEQPRRLSAPKQVWYKLQTWPSRLPVPAYKPLPKARVLFVRTIKLMWRNWKVFLGIIVIYAVLTLFLVRGFSGNEEVGSLKSTLDLLLGSTSGQIYSSLITFATLLTSSTNSGSATSGLYQSTLLVLFSLAFIWVYRQLAAENKVRVQDSFYQGMYPLIPFVLVFLLLGVQLLPLALGSNLYSMMITYGIAVEPWERIGCAVLLFILAAWSLRAITATFFALYIVTLPNMTPLRAYRRARELVRGRRLLIWRKLIFLPVVLVLLMAVLVVPLIFFFTQAAVWVFFGLSMFALPIVHGYMYSLYREMI